MSKNESSSENDNGMGARDTVQLGGKNEGRPSPVPGHSSSKSGHSGSKQGGSGLKTSHIIAIAVIAILLIAGGVAVWYFKSQNSSYTRAQSKFQEALSLVQDTDATVIAIDDGVNGKVTADQLSDLSGLVDKVADEQDKLTQAVSLLSQVESEYTARGNGDIVAQLKTSATSRQDMLEKGSSIITYDIAAIKSSNDFSQAWTLIVNADTNSRNAIAAAADGTPETAATARDTNQQALTDLASAQTFLQTAAVEFPEADFSPVENYVAAMVQAIQYAHDSEDALVNGDTDTSATLASEYATADSSVAALATALPADLTTIIVGAYDSATSTAQVEYQAARTKAIAADDAVRTYLGIEVAITGSAASSTGISVEPVPVTTSASSQSSAGTSTSVASGTASGATSTSAAAAGSAQVAGSAGATSAAQTTSAAAA